MEINEARKLRYRAQYQIAEILTKLADQTGGKIYAVDVNLQDSERIIGDNPEAGYTMCTVKIQLQI